MMRRDKIRQLLDSPIAGERQAAAAALRRTEIVRPQPGSAEWCKAMIAHRRMVDDVSMHLGHPSLTRAEAITIRRWVRAIGNPWEDGAEELRRLHRKLGSFAVAGTTPALENRIHENRI